MYQQRRIRPGLISACLTALMVIIASFVGSAAADAAEKKAPRVVRALVPAPEKDAAIIIDGATGKVLYSRNPDASRYPASLTKMMTLYLMFEALDKRRISLDTPLIASVHAAEQEPTKLNMGPGASIPVDTAIKALTVLSANDVAVVIAEALSGGSEETFGSMMTEKARELGMTHTNFHNASGLPDLQQLTTARDMALLARHLVYDFPEYYHYFSVTGFTYGGRSYATHDNLLAAFTGTDGIKTGYTQLSGFNLVTSAVRDNKHVIGVVLGGPTAAVRDREMIRLLTITFDVAKSDATLLADADAPWIAGKGPGYGMFRTIQGEDNPVLLAALEPKGKTRPTSKSPPAEVLVANVSSGSRAAAVLKTARETQSATTPVLATREAENIEIAQLEPIADAAAVQVAQGDASGPSLVTSDLPEPEKTTPVVSAPARPSAKPVMTIAAPTIPALASLAAANPVLANNGAVKHWAVQIGAFASEALARARLAVFARNGFDVIGQAQKLIVPYTSAGRIMYRARFGMFAETEARDICKRMTQRGQTCFAAPADAG